MISPTVLNWKPQHMQLIAAAAAFSDVVAIHSYVQGSQEPETSDDWAALSWYLAKMRDTFKPGAPVMATETGYNTQVRPGSKGISQRAAAIYLPRLLLYNFQSGIRRTFLYELMDGGTDPHEWEHHWGLVHHDGRPKPSFTAVSALLNAVKDDASGAVARTPPPQAVMRNAPPDARMVQLRQRDGSLTVALWRAVRSWDPRSRSDIPVQGVGFNISVDKPLGSISWMLPNEGAAWSTLASTDTDINVRVDDRVLLLRLVPAA